MSYDPIAAWSAAYWEWMREFYGPELGRKFETEFNSRWPSLSGPGQVLPDRFERNEDPDPRPARRPNKPPVEPADSDAWNTQPEPPRHKFDNLIVPPATRDALDLAMNKVVHAKIVYEDFNMKSVDTRGRRAVINFFGPPGTGKTFAAHCIADRLGKDIIEADYSQIESKWIGDTEKNIAHIFDQARRTDSVLFFDEADAMLGSRVDIVSGSDQHINRSRTVMLMELEQFDGVVVFATNNIGNYDRAFARRIIAHVEFGLPDGDNRRRLWQYLLPAQVPRREDVTAQWLGAMSEGFSGGDILNAAWLMATAAAVKPEAERFVTTEDAARAIDSVRLGLDSVGKRPQRR